MKIVNCTPHDVVLVHDGIETTYPTSGIVARCKSYENEVTGFPFPAVTSTFGDVDCLPERKPDTVYIVSLVVFNATDREDVIRPDSGPTAIRNEKGQIQAVRRFVVK